MFSTTSLVSFGFGCSLQDYVVDPLAEGVWDCMGLLRGPFGNSDILKVSLSIRASKPCDVGVEVPKNDRRWPVGTFWVLRCVLICLWCSLGTECDP